MTWNVFKPLKFLLLSAMTSSESMPSSPQPGNTGVHSVAKEHGLWGLQGR